MLTIGHMTKVKMKKILILGIALVLLIQSAAAASVCTVLGYVEHEDGTPAPEGTIITIADIDLGLVYNVSTGGNNWPAQNFFVKSFTCNFGTDKIEVVHILDKKVTKKEFIFDRYPYEITLTIPNPQKPPETPVKEPTSSKSSGGGGSGGGGGPSGYYPDLGKILNTTGNNIVEFDSKIRIYIINESLDVKMVTGTVKKIDESTIRIIFDLLDEEITLKLDKPLTLDLNKDGKNDTILTLIKLTKDAAYINFDKQFFEIKNETINNTKTNEIAPKEEIPMPNKTNKSLLIFGIILFVVFIMIIIIDRKTK